jgi:hypothetical protein
MYLDSRPNPQDFKLYSVLKTKLKKIFNMSGENDEIVIRNRGSAPVRNEETARSSENTVEETPQNNVEQPEQQQQPQESIWKSILTRLFIFWLISQFFKSRQSTTSQSGVSVTASRNLFPIGTQVVCYKFGIFFVLNELHINIFIQYKV